MLLPPLELTPSGRPVLLAGEVERMLLDKVDLEFEEGGGGVEGGERADRYKDGYAVLTTHRLMWLDAASSNTPSGRRSCCLALEAVASARRRSQLAFSLAAKVRVEVRVYADASRRPVPAAAARVASMSLLMLRCRGPAPDAFAAALEAAAATAAAAAARRPAVASHALPLGALPLNPATDSLASGSFSALPGAPGDQLRMAQQLYQQEQQQRQRQQQSAATATAIGPVVLPPPSSFAREPDAAMLRGIVEMGFSRAQGRRALLATGNEGVQQALDWILAFGEGGDGEEGAGGGGVAPMADSPPPPPSAAPAAPASASFPSAGSYAYVPPAVYRAGDDRGAGGGFANPLSAGLPPARPVPPTTTALPPPSSVVGVSGILQRQQARTAATGQSMDTAFRDLNALMAAAQEMVALAERFRAAEGDGAAAGAAGTAGTTTAVGASSTSEPLMIDRETQLQLIALGIASPVTRESAGARFTLELARQLADFVLSPVPAEGRRRAGEEEGAGAAAAAGGAATAAAASDGLLARAGGVMLLHDVYCLFNRARGVELVSPEDLIAACEAFGRADGSGEGGGSGAASSTAAAAAAAASLGLPIRLRRLPSGVLVLQSTAFSDEELCRRIQELVDYEEEEEQGAAETGEEDEEESALQQRRQRGRQRPPTKVRPGALGPALFEADAARALRLPLALAREALRVAEQRGVLCRDEGGAEGLAFYRNFFLEC